MHGVAMCPLANQSSEVPLAWCWADHLQGVEFQNQNEFLSVKFQHHLETKEVLVQEGMSLGPSFLVSEVSGSPVLLQEEF